MGTSYLIESGEEGPRPLPRNCSEVPVPAGHRVTVTTGGGGGYGDPLGRDPAMVLADVVNGIVSRESAERDYAVVLAPTGDDIDLEATEERRRDTVD